MSRRFGRNQKRRAREEIAKLYEVIAYHNQTIGMWRDRAQSLERQVSNAEARAFERFMADKDRYEAICDRLAHEVGRVAGENLKPYAEQLMRQANQHRPMVRFAASSDPCDMMVKRVTVEWPAVRYNYAVMT